jgi:hypothetical protein
MYVNIYSKSAWKLKFEIKKNARRFKTRIMLVLFFREIRFKTWIHHNNLFRTKKYANCRGVYAFLVHNHVVHVNPVIHADLENILE